MPSFMTLPVELHYMLADQFDLLPPETSSTSEYALDVAPLRRLVSALSIPNPTLHQLNLRNLYTKQLAIRLKHLVGPGMILAQRQYKVDDRENFRIMWTRKFAFEIMQIDIEIGSEIRWFWEIFFQVWYDQKVRIPHVKGNGWPEDVCCDNFGCPGDCDNRGMMPIKPFLAHYFDNNEVLNPVELEHGMAEIAAGCRMVGLAGFLLERRIKRWEPTDENLDIGKVRVRYVKTMPVEVSREPLFYSFCENVLQWIGKSRQARIGSSDEALSA
ncbi:hypothetical protein BJ508DRAFT_417944 [Ascobolus immersus RN42]|uniref:Uncharacterized protein n=1 Tax=Ascobolus immersus RN42 TaxID=1160509 RepID=A0A3N4HPL1_ASCIM|nr:hypothetical protein BJ508DRAFT_417944 [Ascobolus immersus RN42]